MRNTPKNPTQSIKAMISKFCHSSEGRNLNINKILKHLLDIQAGVQDDRLF